MSVHVERIVRVVKRSLLAGELEVLLHWSLKRTPVTFNAAVFILLQMHSSPKAVPRGGGKCARRPARPASAARWWRRRATAASSPGAPAAARPRRCRTSRAPRPCAAAARSRCKHPTPE